MEDELEALSLLYVERVGKQPAGQMYLLLTNRRWIVSLHISFTPSVTLNTPLCDSAQQALASMRELILELPTAEEEELSAFRKSLAETIERADALQLNCAPLRALQSTINGNLIR